MEKIFASLKDIGKRVWESVNPEIPTLKAEEMNPQSIAMVINRYIIGNPTAPLNRSPEERTFTIGTVLANSGHELMTTFQDQFKVHPREYRAARQALSGLVRTGILTEVKLEKPSGYEDYGYIVTDYQNLITFLNTPPPKPGTLP